MHYIAILSVFTVFCFAAASAQAGGEIKKVCHQEKGKEICKTIKVHKKLEGTKIPPK